MPGKVKALHILLPSVEGADGCVDLDLGNSVRRFAYVSQSSAALLFPEATTLERFI
jgi:hypothetical protein